MRVRRQFSLRKLQRQINGITISEYGRIIEGETDMDHLLENSEDTDRSVLTENEQPPRQLIKSQTNLKENCEKDELDKYKIPSSMIVLNDEDKKRLEYVLLQIGLREVGLG